MVATGAAGGAIRRYNKPETLFYPDPPCYYGVVEDYYGPVLERADFKCLADQLASVKGRFIMSLNDTPEVRSIFAGFEIETARLVR